MCQLSQTSRKNLYIHISSSVSSFVQTFLPAMFTVLVSTHALNYTSFPGLVQVAAVSECGASLHGHRKCSQTGSPLVNCDLGESALEGGYTWASTSPEKQRGTRVMFSLTCNPALRANQLFNSSIRLIPSGGVTVSNPDWYLFSVETLQPWQPICDSLTQPVTQSHEEQYIRKINVMLDCPLLKYIYTQKVLEVGAGTIFILLLY